MGGYLARMYKTLITDQRELKFAFQIRVTSWLKVMTISYASKDVALTIV